MPMVLEIKEKSGKKYNLWIDGERYGRWYPGDLRELGFSEVSTGQILELTESALAEFEHTVLLPRAKRRSLFLLGKKEYTSGELKKKLVTDGYSEMIVASVLAYLSDLHYVDDFSYGERYAFSLLSKCSERELFQKMLQKGLEKELVKEAIAAAKERYRFEQEGTDKEEVFPELEAIRIFLQKKGYNPDSSSPEKKKKMIVSLYRKGFAMSDIQKILGEVEVDYEGQFSEN